MKNETRIDFDKLSYSDVVEQYFVFVEQCIKEGTKFRCTLSQSKDITLVEVMRDILKMHDAYLHGEYKDITNEEL